MAVSKISMIPSAIGMEIPSSYINSKITVSKKYLRKYGSFCELILEGTANAAISSWEYLVTKLPDGYKPYESSNAFFINIASQIYICNINASGTINTIKALSQNDILRFHAVYFIEK